jgi:hypothetical protein
MNQKTHRRRRSETSKRAMRVPAELCLDVSLTLLHDLF